jgi:hypothetical protein
MAADLREELGHETIRDSLDTYRRARRRRHKETG